MKLSNMMLWKITVRSFFLQASWNFERLQNIGMLFTVFPALKVLYGDDELQAACARHLEYFNTHPYLANPLIGAVLHLEDRASRDKGFSEREGADFRDMVMAPYAAMGDAFFWGGARPLAACVALFFAAKNSLWAPVVYLVLFNGPHIAYRLLGVFYGYRLGMSVVQIVQRHHLPDLALKAKEMTVVMLGGLSAYLTAMTLRRDELSLSWGLCILPVVLLFGWLARRGLSVLLIVLAFSVLVLLLGTLF